MFWNQQVPPAVLAAAKKAPSTIPSRKRALAGAEYRVFMQKKKGQARMFGIEEKQLEQVRFHRVLWKGEKTPFPTRAQAQIVANQLNAEAHAR